MVLIRKLRRKIDLEFLDLITLISGGADVCARMTGATPKTPTPRLASNQQALAWAPPVPCRIKIRIKDFKLVRLVDYVMLCI